MSIFVEDPRSADYYTKVVQRVDRIYSEAGVDHRFVGGVVSNLIGPQTTAMINAHRQEAFIGKHKPFTLFRSDGTVIDLDIIGFSSDQRTYQEARRQLHEERSIARKKGLPYPLISCEPTHYPDQPDRNKFFQFVSGIDIDAHDRIHLVFGNIDQIVDSKTFENWRLTFAGSNGQKPLTLSGLNLVAYPERYRMRSPSGLKDKDRRKVIEHQGVAYSKIDVSDILAEIVYHQGVEQGVDYRSLYQSWKQFTDTLLNHPDNLTRFKASIMRAYWASSFGTAAAHGLGILGPLAQLGPRFGGY